MTEIINDFGMETTTQFRQGTEIKYELLIFMSTPKC